MTKKKLTPQEMYYFHAAGVKNVWPNQKRKKKVRRISGPRTEEK